jgi:hypothetical protein
MLEWMLCEMKANPPSRIRPMVKETHPVDTGEITLDVPASVVPVLEGACTAFEALVASQELASLRFEEYGREQVKTFKCSPGRW